MSNYGGMTPRSEQPQGDSIRSGMFGARPKNNLSTSNSTQSGIFGAHISSTSHHSDQNSESFESTTLASAHLGTSGISTEFRRPSTSSHFMDTTTPSGVERRFHPSSYNQLRARPDSGFRRPSTTMAQVAESNARSRVQNFSSSSGDLGTHHPSSMEADIHETQSFRTDKSSNYNVRFTPGSTTMMGTPSSRAPSSSNFVQPQGRAPPAPTGQHIVQPSPSTSRPSPGVPEAQTPNPSSSYRDGNNSDFNFRFTPGSTMIGTPSSRAPPSSNFVRPQERAPPAQTGQHIVHPSPSTSRALPGFLEEQTPNPSSSYRDSNNSNFNLGFTPGNTVNTPSNRDPPSSNFVRPQGRAPSAPTGQRIVHPSPSTSRASPGFLGEQTPNPSSYRDSNNSNFNLRFTPGNTVNTPSTRATPSSTFLRPQGRAPSAATGRRIFYPSPAAAVQPSPGALLRTPFPSPFPPPSSTPRSIGRGGGETNSNLHTPQSAITNRSRHNDENVIAAVAYGRGFSRGEVGMAVINMTSCELYLCQMSDTNNYVKTMAKMNLFRPTEVLMPDTTLTATTSGSATLAECIQRSDPELVLTSVGRKAFNDANAIQLIEKLAVADDLNIVLIIQQKYYALSAASALMSHLENNLNVTFAPKTLRIFYRGPDETALLDSETSHRLELVGSLNPNGGPSLLSALNYCQTAAGSRLLRSNILEPSTNREAINRRLDAVQELVSRPTDLQQPIKDTLSKFVDVERAVNQCIVVPKNFNLSMMEQRLNAVVALKHILTLIPPLRSTLSKARSPLISSFVQELNQIDYGGLLSEIQTVVDDRAKVVKGKIGMARQRFGIIKTGVNRMLDVCRQTYNDIEVEIEGYVEELAEKYQIPLVLANTASRGYHLQKPTGRIKGDPTTRTDIQLPPVFICVKRQGNCFAFTTQHLLVTNERVKSVQRDVEKITNVVIEELLGTIRGQIGSLYKLKEMICQLDVVVSFAQVSSGVGFCRPIFGQAMLIRDGRHPVLNRFSSDDLASNDTEMREECNFLVITGANMSGKSTYIRQVMLLQIMAQIGCFVPASSASFRIVDQLFSRLGTSDRLENNASSFSLEMMEMNYIVRNAGPNSLVILDELCKGTDADQGSAICWAICEALLKCGAWTLIATHSTLITKLCDIYFPVENYHMEVIEETKKDGRLVLNYTHRILPGVTQVENYGMKLAAMVNLPPEVLAQARELLPTLAANVKPPAKVTLDFKMSKLNYRLNLKLRDVGRRMSNLPDQKFLEELEEIRRDHKEQLSKLMAEEGELCS